MDILYVGLASALFGLSVVFIRLCDRLFGGGS